MTRAGKCPIAMAACCLYVVLAAFPALAANAIRWQSGPAPLPVEKALPAPGHVVVQFDENPSPETRATLDKQGLTLLAPLGEHAWFARWRGAKALDASTVPLTMVAPRTEWKLSPRLQKNTPPPYIVQPTKVASNGEMCAVYIQFHRDVDTNAAGVPIAVRHGARIVNSAPSFRCLVAEVPFGNLRALAAEDVVQWIEPALPGMGPLNDGNRRETGVDMLSEPPDALDGTGVTVMVYDAGVADAMHPDFGGRLTAHDLGEPQSHATHVAGTIGGDGTNSALRGGMPFQWRGMAPGARLESYTYTAQGNGITLYSDLGDIEQDYRDALTNFGATLANNSIGTNIGLNSLDCTLIGDYGAVAGLIDGIVAGALGAPFRVVWAAGNERSTPQCPVNYASIDPPSGAKNPIVVGAINSNDDSMTAFSSWGPTDDGRLKPDLCAPGAQRGGDNGVTSTALNGGYSTLSGTSMSAPTVTGICALLLQDLRARFPRYAQQDPPNALLKALLVHTAIDQGNPGPDYQYGYGAVRAAEAVVFERTGRFREDTLSDRAVKTYVIEVPQGLPELKVTVVWDDVPSTLNVVPALVNDLDLTAVSPSGTVHYPWTLDPARPENPAARTNPDHTNNIEQVFVATPEPGQWVLRVTGYNVADGQQSFSLATTPGTQGASSTGTIAFTAAEYRCEGVAEIEVVDSDLNQAPTATELAWAHVYSTNDNLGIVIALVETGPSTGVFKGLAALNANTIPGTVRVVHGGTLYAEYADADTAQGVPATARAQAPIDCEPATVSQVRTESVSNACLISFTTSEPARCHIRYGTNTESLAGDEGELRYATAHTMRVSGLTPLTTYAFIIEATDQAGNDSETRDGAVPFTFTTGPRIDQFTELFSDTFDLAHSTLILTPDDTAAKYHAQTAHNLVSLPTDPSGGVRLNLADDDSAQIFLSPGRLVSVYGVPYSAFFVGSNGYLTFTQRDTIQVPSFSSHFAAPRVSALFQDLDPSAWTGGTISYKEMPDHVAVTWQNVPRWNVANSENTFQIRMYFNGRIELSWLDVNTRSGIAGISAGGGEPIDLEPSDLSHYPLDGLLLHPLGTRRVYFDEPFQLGVGADSPLQVPLFTAANLPSGATFVDNGDGTGTFAWTPRRTDQGRYDTLTLTATDGAVTLFETVILDVVHPPNQAPSASDVALEPDNPAPWDNLLAVYTYADPNQDPQAQPDLRWYRNGEHVAALDGRTLIRADQTFAGDTWRYTLRPFDGIDYGAEVQSPLVVIRRVGDLNGDGRTDVLDLQLVINAALGFPAHATADTNLDGRVDAFDIQVVILVLLGFIG